jgi:hypothetical protein
MATITVKYRNSGKFVKTFYNARYFPTKTHVIIYGVGDQSKKQLGKYNLKTYTWTATK